MGFISCNQQEKTSSAFELATFNDWRQSCIRILNKRKYDRLDKVVIRNLVQDVMSIDSMSFSNMLSTSQSVKDVEYVYALLFVAEGNVHIRRLYFVLGNSRFCYSILEDINEDKIKFKLKDTDADSCLKKLDSLFEYGVIPELHYDGYLFMTKFDSESIRSSVVGVNSEVYEEFYGLIY